MSSKLFLAHRGHWHSNTIENTLTAFNRTLIHLDKNSCHGFECDLRQLNKNRPKSWVIFHDETMDRLAKTKGAINPAISLEKNNKKETIPSLELFFKWIKTIRKSITINIEIKDGTLDGISYLINTLRAANNNQCIHFIYSSFNHDYIQHISKTTNETIGLLINNESNLNEDLLTKFGKNLNFIGIRFDQLNNTIIKKIKNQGLKIGIYVKTKDEYKNNKTKIFETADVIFTES